MSKSLLDVVVGLSNAALARMWADLNRWMWPRDLPLDFKPHWWDGSVVGGPETRNRKHGFISPLQDHAESRLTEGQINRAWRAATAQPKAKPAKKRPTTTAQPKSNPEATR